MNIIIKTIFLLLLLTLTSCSAASKKKKLDVAREERRAETIEALEEIGFDDSIPEDTGD